MKNEIESEKKIAVFFDAENVSSKYALSILDKLKSLGVIIVQRAYADWSVANTKSWKELLSRQPIIAMQQFQNGEAQAVDKVIIMDAIEIAVQRPDLDIIAIVSSDNGFAPLALRLREKEKYVLGIGEKQKAKEFSRWVNACNEFWYVEDLKVVSNYEDLELEDVSDKEATDFSLEVFLADAYDATPKTSEGWVLLSRLSQTCKAKKPDFESKIYGFKTFKKLIENFSSEYRIKDDGLEVPSYMIIRKEIDEEEERTGVILRYIGEKGYGIIKSENGDYYFHRTKIVEKDRNVKIKRGMKVSFIVEKSPDSNAKEQKDQNGRATKISFY